MTRSVHVELSDLLLIRRRDKNGIFDAREVIVALIFNSSISTVDEGQVWMAIDQLREMTGMEGEATYLVRSEACPLTEDVEGWTYKDNKFLLQDLDLLVRHSRVASFIIFTILLTFALLAVFDSE